MNRLHEQGLMTDGAHLEFLGSHTNVLFQPSYDDPRYGGLNPYVLGFNILRDIERASTNPDDEDRRWLQSVAGCGDPVGAVKDAAANFRDESLIRQFLSPKVIRSMRLFAMHDAGEGDPFYRVRAIHEERGYQQIRETLADKYEWAEDHPKIEAIEVAHESRHLTLRYTPHKGRYLKDDEAEQVMWYIRSLWTRSCTLVDGMDGDSVIYECD
jgi:spore cortex formation protein SpoVR/YcgB (stage V sporulation)